MKWIRGYFPNFKFKRIDTPILNKTVNTTKPGSSYFLIKTNRKFFGNCQSVNNRASLHSHVESLSQLTVASCRATRDATSATFCRRERVKLLYLWIILSWIKILIAFLGLLERQDLCKNVPTWVLQVALYHLFWRGIF